MSKYKDIDFIDFNALDKPTGMIIAYELHQRDWKQYELADKLSTKDKPVSDKTVSSWIEGSRNVGIDNLKKLCKVFDCNLDYLIGLQSSPKRQVSSVRENTGLSDQAIKILMKLHKDADADTIQIIDAFIRDCMTGSAGSPSLVSYIKQYKHSSDIIEEYNNLPDDQKVEVMPEGHSIVLNEDKQAASLYHASRIFSNMIAKHFASKHTKKR